VLFFDEINRIVDGGNRGDRGGGGNWRGHGMEYSLTMET
jgi:hypothetical protein